MTTVQPVAPAVKLPPCSCGFHYLSPGQQPNWDGDRTYCSALDYEKANGVSLATVASARYELAHLKSMAQTRREETA